MDSPLRRWRGLLAILVFVAAMGADSVSAVDTVFTYQGQLNDAGMPATGAYDFELRLYDGAALGTGTQFGSTVTTNDVAVTDGLFTVQLDFGMTPFDAGFSRYLEIGVRPGASSGAYTILGPRQRLTATPYALFAGTIPNGAVTTAKIASGAVQPDNVAFTYAGSATKGGPPLDVQCSGCIGSTDLATGAVGSLQLADGAVNSFHVAFNYAASSSKGGPATDLVCGACVAETDLASGAVTPQKIAPGGVGQVLITTGAGVAWQSPAGSGDITAVNTPPESGLSGGANAGDVTLALNFVPASRGSSGMATTVARGDHIHFGETWTNSYAPGLAVATTAIGPFVAGFYGKQGVGAGVGPASPGAGVWGDSASGSGVEGTSGSGPAVKGTSTSGRGVDGASTNSQGVAGLSTNSSGVYGFSASQIGVEGVSTTGTGVSGLHNGATGMSPGVRGETKSTTGAVFPSTDAPAGVLGLVASTSPGAFSAGVRGINAGTGGSGIGVYGSQAGGGWGVYGTAVSGRGVYGAASATSGVGVRAEGNGATGTALEIANGAIRVPSSSTAPVFVHEVTSVTTASAIFPATSTLIDHALTNGDSSAILIVTPRGHTGLASVRRFSPPVAAYYDTGASKWRLYSLGVDLVAKVSLPLAIDGDSYNVLVLKQ